MAVTMERATTLDEPDRCTDCGAGADNLTWFPFTAYVCPRCAAKRWAIAEAERTRGEVCSGCRKPYSLCVC